MPRASTGRNEISSMTVRLSAAERDRLCQKAATARMKLSDAMRAAFESWEPPIPSVRVERDPEDWLDTEEVERST
jgi:hypothetical protein